MGWEIRMSNSRGVPYYFNADTKESSWDTPEGLNQDEVKGLPGAHYLEGSGGKPKQVRASHLLVKHSGSRRPSSWKEPNITRSKEEAIEILRGYQQQIGNDAKVFGELAAQHSDCGSHSSNGDLGLFGAGQMQKPFEEAAFALDVGQISDVVSTDSGVHLIMRTA
ncbi:hypothetical protein HGRIS_008534 [Hohenbuehelia grisea]|uniref:Peptidyl-prolyl cis-trans isomerase n=1 Tax=Hohenbuehelia grisea TaxID=104357 RepID=A0ABR3J887_9AGAR